MGGAFVAVASDSSATWWNPAGLGPGPFLDFSMSKAITERRQAAPGWRATTSWMTLATPPLGLSYYRFRLTDIQPSVPTENGADGREDSGAGVSVRSLSASQFGVTVLRTVVTGVHTGTTLKYIRATPRSASGDAGRSASDLLDQGEALEGGDAEGEFDVDIGILAVAGALRLGAVARNMREPEFHGVTLPRQYRVGVAIDTEPVGGPPLTIAFDADVKEYDAGGRARKVLAAGVEQWLFQKRVGVRGGARLNTTGLEERSFTAGLSVAPRAGFFLEGHVVRGGTADDEGWGVGARISF
jgi:hypothetical protein